MQPNDPNIFMTILETQYISGKDTAKLVQNGLFMDHPVQKLWFVET